MKSTEIRDKFLNFFKERGHAILPSASLVPENDSSVLFNTAGMQPLVPYLLGQKHPLGARLANIQKCVRTGDLDEIGDNTHATFFEMMGNWSLGDYFKEEAINWSYELLTDKEKGFGLDPNRLYVTCFEGDNNAPRDEESAKIWQNIFDKNNIKGNRIFFLPAKNNWWSPGDNGPCGPDTEMFYDITGNYTNGLTHEEYLAADEKQEVVEIWNDVFMEYEKKDGKVIGKLTQKNVDTGSGFERVTMVLQGKNNIFDTDIFEKIMGEINSLSVTENLPADKSLRAKRIVADHIRTSVMLMSDGVLPSNSDQGYVLRRLLRRVIVQSDKLEMGAGSISKIAEAVIETYSNVYENVSQKSNEIITEIQKEEEKFRKTLNEGISKIKRLLTKNHEITTFELSGETLFDLYQSNGFPVELSFEEIDHLRISAGREPLSKESKTLFLNSFNKLLEKHQEISRQGSEQKFKGGLGDTSEMSLKYHTATHLLHQALRMVLGEHVSQKGSNITPERLRFDFTHGEKMTDEQKSEVEKIVNEQIAAKLPVNVVTLPKEEAEKTGALHFFGEKYPNQVTVYYIGENLETAFSKEFCGGPHVKNISELGHFKIQKEEASSAGVRRIKAILER